MSEQSVNVRRVLSMVVAFGVAGGTIAVPDIAAAQQPYRMYGYGPPARPSPYAYSPAPVVRTAQPTARPKAEAPRRTEAPKAAAPAARKQDAKADPVPASTPLVAVVSIRDQRISVYGGTTQIARSGVSSGRSGYETPQGVFSVIQKEVEHFSNLYDDAPMPYMQRITWSGVALHAGNLPGYPASHGCIRLPHEFSKRLYSLMKMNTRVIVSSGDVTPVDISHPRLAFLPPAPAAQPDATPRPDGPPMMLGAGPGPIAAVRAAEPPAALEARKAEAAAKAAEAAKAADAAKALVPARTAAYQKLERAARIAEGAVKSAEIRLAAADRAVEAAKLKAQDALIERAVVARQQADAKIAELKPAAEAARKAADAAKADLDAATLAAKSTADARTAAAAEARRAARAMEPVSVFISRKTQRLYVRQGFEPMFDMPVAIADPAKPIGTHVYTAIARTDGAAAMRWTAVTPQAPAADRSEAPAPRKKGDAPAPVSTAASATKALDRIDIPAEALEKISSLMKPGSSLIISDHAISPETGKGTDFVILTR